MIVDFISIKEKLYQGITLLLRAEVKKRTPFLSLIGSRLTHEGHRSSYETVYKEKKNLEYQRIEISFSLTREEMSKITFQEILKKVEEISEDMARQMEGGAIQQLSKEIERAGKTFSDNPISSPEAIIKGLEMIDIDFDDARDKPRLPSILIHPSQLEKLREQDERMTDDEKREFRRREEQILDKKYEEYVTREEKRKLVD